MNYKKTIISFQFDFSELLIVDVLAFQVHYSLRKQDFQHQLCLLYGFCPTKSRQHSSSFSLYHLFHLPYTALLHYTMI